MKKVYLFAIVALIAGCKKTDYYHQEFTKGEKVKLNGINPKASPVPYNCCTCPCIVDTAYIKVDAWFYNIHDQAHSTLTHVDNGQLKKW